MLELAELELEEAGSRSEIVFEPLPADDPTPRRTDIGYARKILEWESSTDLADGLRKTIAYFKDRPDV